MVTYFKKGTRGTISIFQNNKTFTFIPNPHPYVVEIHQPGRETSFMKIYVFFSDSCLLSCNRIYFSPLKKEGGWCIIIYALILQIILDFKWKKNLLMKATNLKVGTAYLRWSRGCRWDYLLLFFVRFGGVSSGLLNEI